MTLSAHEGHPSPLLMRETIAVLDRQSGFRIDHADVGLGEHWYAAGVEFDRTIVLPFSPESPASGVNDTGYHRVVWYRIPYTAEDLAAAGASKGRPRMLLHFGAVDDTADVWVDGVHVGRHEGGQSAFAFDITHAVSSDGGVITVRAEDDPLDVTTPRGKQDWMPEPHVIWYHRVTGIWRSVWLEAVPEVHVARLSWRAFAESAQVELRLELNRRPDAGTVEVRLAHDGVPLARATVAVDGDDRPVITAPLSVQRNGQSYEELLWSPERPTLLEASVEVHADGSDDVVASYVGVRSTTVDRGAFLLNDRPVFVRSVLEQGYWPESHYTPPSADAARAEVELVKSLGFNAIRIHQKVEDPRFLFWCDVLGVMVWGEIGGAYEFSDRAVERLTRQWAEVVRQYSSHPSIVTWVPVNESWGVQHGAHDLAQRAFAVSLANLTRALDPTRPVISNDGWEHTDSDILTIHDYTDSGAEFLARYDDSAALAAALEGMGPAGRRLTLAPHAPGLPVMVTEFGGVHFDPGRAEGWGYSSATDADDFASRVGGLLSAANRSRTLSGFCYTQLTDTAQEKNGLCTEDRVPKLDPVVIAHAVRGEVL